MEPGTTGRTLDAEFARPLFGLTVEPRENKRTHQQDYVYEVNPGQWVQCAYYSATGSAWLTVVEELHKRGWTQVPMPRRQWNEGDRPTVILEHTDGRVVQAPGPVNTALCRAALKAVAL